MNASRRPPADTRRRAHSSAVGSSARRGFTPALPVPALALLLPALAVLALYARTLGHGFVWDDLDLIVRNRALQGAEWWRLLGRDFWESTGGGTGMWRPLVTLSYRIDGLWTGWRPWGFHLVNLLAHMATAMMLARLALGRGLPPWAAAGAGLVFATAPALCEPVGWISGRTDGFVALGTLGALLAAGRWRRKRSALDLVLVAVGVGLALLAKESALAAPLLLAAEAADAVRARTRAAPPGPASPGAPQHAPWSAGLPALLAVVLVGLWAMLHRAMVGAPVHAADPGAAAGMAALVWAQLAWLSPWAEHSPLLGLWQPPATAVAVAAWVALLALAIASGLACRRGRPVLLVVGLLIAPLLPVAAAALLESGVRFAERVLVLPAAGMALGLAMLAAQAPGRARALATGGLALWVVAQLWVTVPLVGVWRDDESRIRRVVAVRPADPDALLGLADLLSSQGRDAEAAALITRAGTLAPEAAADVQVARASAEFRAGRLESALAAAEQALAPRQGAPASERTALAAGMIRVRALVRLGRTAEAVAAAEELLAQRHGEPVAQGALGAARFAAGDVAGALPLLRDASAHLIEDAGLAWDLGRAAIASGDVVLARTAFERAVAGSPEFYDAWLGVADTRSRLGDAAGASVALERAERLPAAADGRAAALRARIATR